MKTRIAISGCDGMLGRAFMALLKEGGNAQRYTAIGFDNFSRRGVVPLLSPYRTDLLSADVDELVGSCDVFINMAADVGGVFYNDGNSGSIFESNARIQSRAVQVAERTNVPMFVQISSVCVYEPSSAEHAETDELGAMYGSNAGYAMAKRSGEVLALESSVPRVLVIRPTNMIGNHDHYDNKAHVIPALIRRLFVPGPHLEVWSSREVVRQFLWADEAARMILDLIGKGDDRGIYNLPANVWSASEGFDLTLGGIAETLCALGEDFGVSKEPLYMFDDPGGEPIRRISGGKTKGVIGERDVITLSEALNKMILEYTKK